MPDVSLWFTMVTSLAACAGAASASIANVHAARQSRAHREQKKWWDEREKLTLIGVAEHANAYALRGVEHPGTQAVRTLYPGFDFTMGGRYPDHPLHDTDNTIYAPWTAGTVTSLAEYQESGTLQPYVCDLDYWHGRLAPSSQGWECRACGHTQRWALRRHADGSWRADRDRMIGVFRPQRPPRRERHRWIAFAQRHLGLFERGTVAPGEDER